ncbi:MAG: glycosyltransferase [Cyanobacteria bacterium CRU_2_1]|nr:glycosyltransferase [Cyanobacteria bacterium RU_5_0]NJR60828.1 glycosyltransferase [Cyanobacteria bacterium CRU_2_1]
MPHSIMLPNSSCLPHVSVVIPIYNGEADLLELLNCLQSQSYPNERVEYLLVDNGSGDRTPQWLQVAAQTHSSIRPLSEIEIQSSYAARNTGIRAATGEILAFTDVDCRPQPEWLYQLIQPFANPAIGIVAGEVMALPGTSLLERYADRHDTLSQNHTLAHPFCPYGQTANLAIRRQALEQVGLFRPYLTTGGDADICWRILRQTGWQIQFAEQAIVSHRHRSTLADLRSQWQRYGRSNRYLHELHGINLTRDMTLRDYGYRGSRWLLKEIPVAIVRQTHFTHLVDAIVDTPIDLICRQARSQGQRGAQLSDLARQIVWLDQEAPVIQL